MKVCNSTKSLTGKNTTKRKTNSIRDADLRNCHKNWTLEKRQKFGCENFNNRKFKKFLLATLMQTTSSLSFQ